VGSTFNQEDVNNGRVVYIHDDSDIDNDSMIYGLGLIYGPQPELGTQQPSSWYFSHVVLLPVVIEQVQWNQAFLPSAAVQITNISNLS